MKAANFKAYEKGSLRGFFDLQLDSGLEIRGMTVHEKEGKRWVSFPSKPYTDDSGETKYQNILAIPDDSRWKAFQRQAQTAVEAVMNGGSGEDVPF